MNPLLDQRQASADAGWKNIINQRSGSNSSLRKLLLLRYKNGVYCRGKNSKQKITITLIQTVCPNSIPLSASLQGMRSSEVGALASVSEKQKIVTEVKLLQRSNTIQNYLDMKKMLS